MTAVPPEETVSSPVGQGGRNPVSPNPEALAEAEEEGRMDAAMSPMRGAGRLRLRRQSALARMASRLVLVIALADVAMLTVNDLLGEHEWMLRGILWACGACFLAEWLFRMRNAQRAGTLGAYLGSARGVIDMAAALVLPAFAVNGVSGQESWVAGALWALKAPAVPAGLIQLIRVVRLEAEQLSAVCALFLVLLFIASVGMHVTEGDLQPDEFGSLPSALWWSLVTLTGGSVGSTPPQSSAGRLVASALMIAGLGIFGLLTGILANGFAAEGRRQGFVQAWHLVARAPLFQSIGPAGITEVAQALRRWEVPENTVVFRRGRKGESMYIVAAGEVEVQIDPPVRLGEGALFGEMALLTGEPRTATVSTTRPTTLLVLDIADFLTVSAHHPALGEAVMAQAARRRTRTVAV